MRTLNYMTLFCSYYLRRLMPRIVVNAGEICQYNSPAFLITVSVMVRVAIQPFH